MTNKTLTVEQRHRDAAADYIEPFSGKLTVAKVRSGKSDHNGTVQAFARFERNLRAQEGREDVIEQCAKVAQGILDDYRASGGRTNQACAAALDFALTRIRALATQSPDLPASKMLSELLAVIHRDGGQYEASLGRERAWQDAMQLSSERIVCADLPAGDGDMRERIAIDVDQAIARAILRPQDPRDHICAEAAKNILALVRPSTGDTDHG